MRHIRGFEKISKNETKIKYNRLHGYFINEPICNKINPEKDVKNLLYFGMGLSSINNDLHEDIFDLMADLYEAEQQLSDMPKNTGPHSQIFAKIDYNHALNTVIDILNKIAPKNTKITVHNNKYQYRIFGIGNEFGPPLLK